MESALQSALVAMGVTESLTGHSKGSGAFPRYRSIDRELKQGLMNLPDEYVMKVLD